MAANYINGSTLILHLKLHQLRQLINLRFFVAIEEKLFVNSVFALQNDKIIYD